MSEHLQGITPEEQRLRRDLGDARYEEWVAKSDRDYAALLDERRRKAERG